MVAGSESPGYGSQNRLPMRDVYSDSTPCVVTVQKNASRYKQRAQRERSPPFRSEIPLSLLAYAQNFRPFLSLENPPPPFVSRLPRLFPIAPLCRSSVRAGVSHKGKDRSFTGKASPPVRHRTVVWCGDDDEHGKRPGLLSVAIRSSSWDMRATLRNRVGDPRAPSHLRTAGATAAFTLQTFHHRIKPPGRTKEKKNAPLCIRRIQTSKQGRINRPIPPRPAGLLKRWTRGETPAIASNPELLGL
jgi:hypothetical protein